MTLYPRWWNDTITIYHREKNAEGRITWTRSTAAGAYVATSKATAKNSDNVRTGHKMICRLRHPAPHVDVGDIIVRGLIVDNINEYAAGTRSSDLIARHGDRAGTVTELHDNTHDQVGLKHVYIGGD